MMFGKRDPKSTYEIIIRETGEVVETLTNKAKAYKRLGELSDLGRRDLTIRTR